MQQLRLNRVGFRHYPVVGRVLTFHDRLAALPGHDLHFLKLLYHAQSRAKIIAAENPCSFVSGSFFAANNDRSNLGAFGFIGGQPLPNPSRVARFKSINAALRIQKQRLVPRLSDSRIQFRLADMCNPFGRAPGQKRPQKYDQQHTADYFSIHHSRLSVT